LENTAEEADKIEQGWQVLAILSTTVEVNRDRRPGGSLLKKIDSSRHDSILGKNVIFTSFGLSHSHCHEKDAV